LYQILKQEIYNMKCSDKTQSPITLDLAMSIRDNNPNMLSNIKQYFSIYPNLIQDKEMHVNALSSRLVLWAFDMNVGPAKKENINQKQWTILIDRILDIISQMDDLKYGRMILCESVAHRCADMLYYFGSHQTEMENNYNEAYLIATELNRYKQMCSSMYYQYIAWKHINNVAKAKQCAQKVASIVLIKRLKGCPRKIRECREYVS